MRDNKNEEPRPQDRSALDRPLTIVLVMDTIGNKGNGTSNSELQYAHELERQGHHVRLVGIGAPEYPARVNKVPLVVADVKAISDALRRAAGDRPDPVIVINADAKATHQSVVDIMQAAQTAGYPHISFATQSPN